MKIFLIYLAAHFLFYALLFRRWEWFSRERNIFFYHFFSVLAWTLVLALKSPGAVFGTAISLHCIYSLSILELWCLSVGSYSLRILDFYTPQGAHAATQDLAGLQSLGQGKKRNRLKDLERSRFARQEKGKFCLTVLGRMSVAFLIAVSWPSNPKEFKQ